jgi:capsular polysaccharide biosynthesis protein
VITEDSKRLPMDATEFDPSYEPLYPPRYEPPPAVSTPVLRAVARYWYLVLLPVLVLAGAAVAVALTRAPVYTAETRLNVGGFNISAQSLPGYAGGAATLATAYSRAAYAHRVIGPVATAVGKSEDRIASMITASPVKDSPIIRLEAQSKDSGEAVRIANLSATNLQKYATVLARSNPDSRRLFHDFRAAAREYRIAALRAARAHRTRKGVEAADTNLDLAQLRKTSVATLYGTSLGGQATTDAVQVLNPAHSATSDRRAVLERLLAGAILGGLAIGVALAYLRARSRVQGRIAR